MRSIGFKYYKSIIIIENIRVSIYKNITSVLDVLLLTGFSGMFCMVPMLLFICDILWSKVVSISKNGIKKK